MRKKVLLKGPILTRSGYGEQTRFALRSLRSRPDLFELYIQPLQWGNTSWIATTDSERAFVDQTIEKTIGHIQAKGEFDLSVQVTIPNEWEMYMKTLQLWLLTVTQAKKWIIDYKLPFMLLTIPLRNMMTLKN